MMCEIQKYCFSERKFNFRRNELLQCAPPLRPPMSCHEFFTYFMLYLSYIEKIILISHFLAAIGHIERNNQKSSIFDISAKFSSLPWSSQTLKMAENGIRMRLYTYKHEY